MELALLSGANPRVSADGPITRLVAGEWLLTAEGNVDSVIGVNVGYGPPTLHSFQHEMKLTLGEASPVQISFRIRGTEKLISVIAKRTGTQ